MASYLKSLCKKIMIKSSCASACCSEDVDIDQTIQNNIERLDKIKKEMDDVLKEISKVELVRIQSNDKINDIPQS